MVHKRLAVTYDDGDDVEAYAVMWCAMVAVRQPLHGRVAQVDLFGWRHGFLRSAVAERPPGFDFDEDDDSRIVA